MDENNKNFFDYFKSAILDARDGSHNNPGAIEVRKLYNEGNLKEAQDYSKQFAKANLLGIGLGVGGGAYLGNNAVKTALNVAGDIDGARNLFTNNGVVKTVREFKAGNYDKAALSGLGDVLDLTAFGGSVNSLRKWIPKQKQFIEKVGGFKNATLIKTDPILNTWNRYTGPRVKASTIGFTGPYKGDWLELRKKRLENGGFEKFRIDDNTTIDIPITHDYIRKYYPDLINKLDHIANYDELTAVNVKDFINKLTPSILPNDKDTFDDAFFDKYQLIIAAPTNGFAYEINKKIPNLVTSHEFGHLIDYIRLKIKARKSNLDKMLERTNYKSSTMKLYNKIPGYDSSNIPKAVQEYFQNNYHGDITELQQRVGQLKDYFGISDSNINITPDMWNYARRHYVKDIGFDNNMQQLFRAVKDPEAFLNFINPYVFKKGGSIKIKPSKKGSFTEYCGGKVTQSCINKAKKSSSKAIRKKAVFAENARKWNKK